MLQGNVQGASEGLRVVAVGTAASATVDDDGQFVMGSLPAGSVSLRFEGGGVDAKLSVDGLRDGLVTSIRVAVTGGGVQLTSPAQCLPSAETSFSGMLEQISGTRIVVSGRPVDVSQLQKVWRGDRRIQFSDLQVGEKVKVWGVLRGDGVAVADEISALTTGAGVSGETFVSFTGKIDSVGASALGASDVHANPHAAYYPDLVVAGRLLHTSDQTRFRWSDGSTLDPRELKAGQTAYVEGWKKADGSVRTTTLKVQGASSGPAWITFRGRVDSVVALARGVGRLDGVSASCYLKLSIAGRAVQTDGSTDLKWSDGSALDPYAVAAGDQAYVEGWSKPEGYVLATKLVVDKR